MDFDVVGALHGSNPLAATFSCIRGGFDGLPQTLTVISEVFQQL